MNEVHGVKKSFPKAAGETHHMEQLGVSLLLPPLAPLAVRQDTYSPMLTSPPCIGHIHPLTSKPICPQRPCTAARVLEEVCREESGQHWSAQGWTQIVEETVPGSAIRHGKKNILAGAGLSRCRTLAVEVKSFQRECVWLPRALKLRLLMLLSTAVVGHGSRGCLWAVGGRKGL